LFNLWKSNKS